MIGDMEPAPQWGPPVPVPDLSTVEPTDVQECPVCYQEYNPYNKCPRILECLHVFCSECLQRIQLCPFDPADPHSPEAIPCPLCRHLTLLENGDPLTLPCNSLILARLPPSAFRLPVTMVTRLATVTQRVFVSLDDDSRETSFIILPSVSLRVQQKAPDRPYGPAPGLVGEEEVIAPEQEDGPLRAALAVIFWVLFVITCVVAVVFGPHFFKGHL
ncbi:LOW QUALITY PROTEIN: E3 ubiquitin-protein ligase RNF182 [Gouania willdenowi]|uniref:LOW QUALITY PROTEIN: E3 ubiquitin-protein ligase RNF182 n=1 Tax=Gouania willdenowi TaxID=441366 RepID=UPI003EBB467E